MLQALISSALTFLFLILCLLFQIFHFNDSHFKRRWRFILFVLVSDKSIHRVVCLFQLDDFAHFRLYSGIFEETRTREESCRCWAAQTNGKQYSLANCGFYYFAYEIDNFYTNKWFKWFLKWNPLEFSAEMIFIQKMFWFKWMCSRW